MAPSTFCETKPDGFAAFFLPSLACHILRMGLPHMFLGVLVRLAHCLFTLDPAFLCVFFPISKSYSWKAVDNYRGFL